MTIQASAQPQPATSNSASGAQSEQQPGAQTTAQVITLHPPSRWHDPLKLIQDEPPSEMGRIVLWSVSILILLLLVWATLGKLDIIAAAEGKLVPQTLLKIVQPAEAGVVKQLLVNEGDHVKAGQVLARLDPTLATADKAGVQSDLAMQQTQARRIEAELHEQPLLPKAGDDPQLYAQVHSQYLAHRQAYLDGLAQEQSLLMKAEHEKRSAEQVLNKLEQTLPTYQKTADAYAKLEKEGFIAGIAAAEKQRDFTEKTKDLDAQEATVAALTATATAQQQKIRQLRSTYQSELEKELAEVKAKIAQLRPTLDKSIYKEGLMELKAPQDGVIKDLATTTVGAVVQPGTVVLTLVPEGEQLYADVAVKNDDVGFTQVGQTAQIKLVAYPFQQYGMLKGKVIHLSVDATEVGKQANAANGSSNNGSDNGTTANLSTYKARIQLDSQVLQDPQQTKLTLMPGMQVIAEINQGKRSVLEYLLSPVQKAVKEAGHER